MLVFAMIRTLDDERHRAGARGAGRVGGERAGTRVRDAGRRDDLVAVGARAVARRDGADPAPVELRVEMARAAAVVVADEGPRLLPTEDAVRLIRGGPTTDAGGSGCACGVVGSGRGAMGGGAGMLLGAVVLGARRRRMEAQ